MIATSVLSVLIWGDNRDMVADPLTKGSADREPLLKMCETGHYVLNHDSKWFACPQLRKAAQSMPLAGFASIWLTLGEASRDAT